MRLKYEKPSVDVCYYEQCDDILTDSSGSTNSQNDLNNDDEYNYIP